VRTPHRLGRDADGIARSDDKETFDEHPLFHHVGLNVDDFDAVYWRAHEQRLRDDSAFFSGMYELPDGSVQMYLRTGTPKPPYANPARREDSS
jgi:hypothetical protein